MPKEKHLMSEDNWLKGVFGLNIVKYALIPSLKEHFSQRAEELNTDDDHLNHLFDLAIKGEVKQTKKDRSVWKVNCSICEQILSKIEKSHIRPARLMWVNNKREDDCPNGYKLARIYMPPGKEDSKDYSDLEASTILEIIKNDITFGLNADDISYLIMIRNRLMHSSSHCIKKEELDDAFARMKKLLESESLKELQECVSAIEELDKLKSKPMTSEVDESNENWNLARAIQTQANKEVRIKSPSSAELTILLKDIQVKLLKERDQREEIQLPLSNASDKYEENQVEHLKVKDIRSMIENEEKLRNVTLNSELANTDHSSKNLKEVLDRMKKTVNSLNGRVVAGSVTGSSIGSIGGPVGAMIGGAVGGAVAGMSQELDKIPCPEVIERAIKYIRGLFNK